MARKAGRFNAVSVSAAVTDDVFAVETRIYRTAFYARLSVELKMKPSDIVTLSPMAHRNSSKSIGYI